MRNLAWQTNPRHDTSLVLLLTGSAGGGKSRLAAQKLHDFCLRYRGATALIVRKARVSITNSTAEFLQQSVIGDDPRVRHVPSKSRFEYVNRSRLMYTGLDDEEQRKRIRSIGGKGGIDIAWMEEATEFEEDDYNAVLARLRGNAAGWRQVILTTNPDAPTHWIYRRLIAGDEAQVYYSSAADNIHNPNDYLTTLTRLTGVEGERLARGQWVQATGIIYDVWADGPPDGNVTEAADYRADAGPIFWGVDDGYVGKLDPKTGLYTADSHPRVFLLIQQRHDGTLCCFAEHYAVETLPEVQLADVLCSPNTYEWVRTAMGAGEDEKPLDVVATARARDDLRSMFYPEPDYVAVDKSAATLKGRMHAAGIFTRNGPSDVEESIKEYRAALAKDTNGRRRFLVHPRCKHLRAEMASYRRDANGKIIKAWDHGPDAARYLVFTKRYEQ